MPKKESATEKKLEELIKEHADAQLMQLILADVERVSINGFFNYRKFKSHKLLCSRCCDYWMIGEGKISVATGIYLFKDKESKEETYVPLCDTHDESDFEESCTCEGYWEMEINQDNNGQNFGFFD